MFQENEIARVLGALRELRAGEGTRLVAIDGLSGAGKSLLADVLQESLTGISVVRADDFYRPMDTGVLAQLSSADGYEQYFDWRRLRTDVLVPLSQGAASWYRRHDWSTNRLAEWHEVQPGGIVIVEGVFTVRPEIREFYGVTVFVEAPRDERVRRIHARDENVAWVDRWMAAEDWYLEHVRPADWVDHIVDGS